MRVLLIFLLSLAILGQTRKDQNEASHTSDKGAKNTNGKAIESSAAQQVTTPQGNDEPQRNHNAPEPQPRPWLTHGELVMAVITGIYVIFTGIYVVISGLTLSAVRNQLLELQKSREQTEHMIDIMDDTRVRQLRAYVSVSSAIITFPRPDAPQAQLEIKNCGNTPAYDVRQWTHMWIEDYPLKVVLPVPPPDFKMASAILQQGCVHTMVLKKYPPVPAESIKLIGTPEGTVYVYGKIMYRDAFGKERSTNYRLMYGGPESIHNMPESKALEHILRPDVEGNDAD